MRRRSFLKALGAALLAPTAQLEGWTEEGLSSLEAREAYLGLDPEILSQTLKELQPRMVEAFFKHQPFLKSLVKKRSIGASRPFAPTLVQAALWENM